MNATLVLLGAAWFAAAEGVDRNPYYPQFPSQRVAMKAWCDVEKQIADADQQAAILGGWNAEQRIDYAFRLRRVYGLWAQVHYLGHFDEGIRDDAAQRLRALVGARDFNMGWVPWGP